MFRERKLDIDPAAVLRSCEAAYFVAEFIGCDIRRQFVEAEIYPEFSRNFFFLFQKIPRCGIVTNERRTEKARTCPKPGRRVVQCRYLRLELGDELRRDRLSLKDHDRVFYIVYQRLLFRLR